MAIIVKEVRMKSHIKTIKNIICYLVAFILVITANIGLLSTFKTDIDTAFAYKGYEEKSLDNQNFNSNTNTDYPFAPSNWTASTDIDDANVKAGVINLNEDDYSKYKKNPLSADEYVLMIDSKDHDARFGYTSDDTIELEADSYYSISVDVYTSNADGIANIYLTDSKGKEFASLTHKSGTWTPYTFFVRTNDIDGETLNLGLYIDGDGIVLYDNISIDELNKDTFETRKGAISNSSLYSFIDLVDNVVSDIEMTTKPFKETNSEKGDTAYSVAGYVNIADDNNADDGNHDMAFKIENKQATYVEYSTNDDYLTFEQNSIQKVTITLKATDLIGKATLQLVETSVADNEEGNDLTAISITNSTSSELELDRDFLKYSFYVKGYPTKEAKYKLVVCLGDADNKSTGTIYISNITVSKTTDDIYSNATTGTTTEKKDLTSGYTFTSQDFILDNGNFNAIENKDYTKSYPYNPTSWSVTTGENDQKYGVINTAKLDGLNVNVKDPDGNLGSVGGNNILMLHNTTADTLSFKSATKSLSAKTYNKFSLQLLTQDAPATVSLVSTKNDNEIVLSSITIDTDYSWQDVELYLYTGYASYDVALKVTLDSSKSAYAFVDNTMFNYFFDQTKESFDDASGTNIIKTDLSQLIASNSDEHFSTPINFVGSNNEAVKAGVVSLDGENLQKYVVSNADYLDTFTDTLGGDNRNVLAIRSLTDVKYTFTSNIGFKLTANSYYKISISVYTQNLQILNTEINDELKGATIELTGFDETFTKIVSDNEWTEYTFYICPNNDVTTYLELSLGGDVTCSGDVFFGNISFVDSGITNFDDIKASHTTLILNKTATNNNEETDPEDTTTTDNSNNNAWIYAIPSVLTALAIIIAVVGVMMRRVKFKKFTRKSKNKTDYDRNKTVSKQIYMRKATTLREDKIRETQKELDSLHAERSKYEEDYKHGLTKLREMKLKRITGSEVNKLEKEIKRNQKASAAIGLNITRLENELEYMKTDSYLNSLMKKLANEPKQAEESNAE